MTCNWNGENSIHEWMHTRALLRFSSKCHLYDLIFNCCCGSDKSFFSQIPDTNIFKQGGDKRRETPRIIAIIHKLVPRNTVWRRHQLGLLTAVFLRHFTLLIQPSLLLEFAFSLQFLPVSISTSHGFHPTSSELGKSRPWSQSQELVKPCQAQTSPINARGSADTKKGFVLSLSD